MKIHLYSICWNERILLPFFLRHYSQFCERITIYDNGSDDGSVEIVKAWPNCRVWHFGSGGEMNEGVLLRAKGEKWKDSRGEADWVICCDIDEFLYHPRLLDYLAYCRDEGITIPAPTGYQMVHDRVPTTADQIYEEVRTGLPFDPMNKRVIFDPSAIEEINYGPGCHCAFPIGNVKEHFDPELKLLHFKFLGLDYVRSRYAQLAKRVSQYNRDRGYTLHYEVPPEELEHLYDSYRENATIVV